MTPKDARPVLTKAGRIGLLLASLAFIAISLRQAATDGATVDETTHVVSGYVALTHHDVRVSPQHPPLAKVLAVLPLLATHVDVPSTSGSRVHEGRAITRQWVRHEEQAGRLHRLIFLARLVPILLTVAVAWALAILASQLFGPRAGPFAAVLWLANPLILGLGHLVTIDIPGVLTAVLAALAVLAARRDPRWVRLLVVGVAAGIAVTTRTTGLLVVASAVAAVGLAAWPAGWRRALGHGAAVAATAWVTVMVVYATLAPGVLVPRRHDVWGLSSLRRFLLPPSWVHGMAYLRHVGSVPGPAFLLGRAHTGRWPAFWPLAMVAKLPPTTVLLLVAAPLACWLLPRAVRREATVVVGIPILLHAAFALQQERPIGLRYLLTPIAFGLVAAAALLAVVPARAVRGIWAVAGAIALACCLMLPSLSWTSPLVGSGPAAAADSNLDWGQSWPALVRWSRTHHPWVSYFGPAGLDARFLAGARPLLHAPADMTGWVAVSASNLTVYERDRLRWLRAYCPVGVLDRTIVLYRFRNPPDRTLRGPDAPRSCRRPFSG
ncbi:MAG: hypothetical protein JWM05_3180 [Acidimicrobiales bacterium]|nr:hypothetical protein [Acidimicrobiales bacterium]